MTWDPERLDSLERTIERLAHELAEVRRALAALRSESSPGAGGAPVRAEPPVNARAGIGTPEAAPSSPLAERPREPGATRRAARDDDDGLEKLIGRYGALALAVLTIVMGAGALVSWAVSHGLLGPRVRVTLGALLALVIASTGWWLRARGSRRFGNVLLALSLAVVQVVAWGAGPRLGLVPSSVSLGVADAAALALAALALAESEQLLYAAGLGGALMAPFVMATGEPHYGVLAAYGLILLAMAIRTIEGREWWYAVGLVLVGTLVYTLTVSGYQSGVLWVDREFAVVFAGVTGVIALVWERRPSRPWIAVCAVTTMAIAFATHRAGPYAATRLEALFAAPDVPLLALAGTALLFGAVRDINEREQASVWTLAVILLPGVFLSAALGALGPVGGPVSGSFVLVWALAYSVSSLREQGSRRGVLITASGLTGLWAITLVLDRATDAVPPMVAAYAVLLAAVSKRERQPVVLLATAVSLLVSFWVAAAHLAAQAGYTMTPFLSLASLGVASAVGAVFLSARYGLPDRASLFNEEFERDRVGVLAVSALAFLWSYLELRRAFSADVSTFLLIAYFATCGVLAIHQGRVRGNGRLRQVGLSLAVLAALYAIIEASNVQQIGLRVGSYLLVGGFLLGVAWWYRGEGRAVADQAGRTQ
jgi:hypothetical protein